MIVPFGFYALSVIAFGMVITLLTYADNVKKFVTSYFIVGLAWLLYLLLISKTGILENFSLPPRAPLLIVIPTVIASVVVTGKQSFRNVLKSVPLHLPVFLTSFRILVELLIYGAYREGVFPQRVTFEGLNYDIIVGLSACLVGVLLLKRKFPLWGLLVWNFLSLLVLALTVYSFVSTYYFPDHMSLTNKLEFVQFPYLLLAGVLLPIAIFLHVFSIRQVFMNRDTHN